jgi:hypothetical protein
MSGRIHLWQAVTKPPSPIEDRGMFSLLPIGGHSSPELQFSVFDGGGSCVAPSVPCPEVHRSTLVTEDGRKCG